MNITSSTLTFIAVFCASVLALGGTWVLTLVTGFFMGIVWRMVYSDYICKQNIALEAMAARFAKDQAEYDAESDPFKDVGKPPF